MSNRRLLIIVLVFLPVTLQAVDMYSFTNSLQSQRFWQLTHDFRCLVCQNQSLAESDAPLAADLRNKIYHMVLQGRTNIEIKAFLTKRYGEFILLKPRFNLRTVVLWCFPFIIIIVGALGIFRRKKRYRIN